MGEGDVDAVGGCAIECVGRATVAGVFGHVDDFISANGAADPALFGERGCDHDIEFLAECLDECF